MILMYRVSTPWSLQQARNFESFEMSTVVQPLQSLTLHELFCGRGFEILKVGPVAPGSPEPRF